MSGAKASNNIGYDYGVLTAKAGLAVMVPWPNISRLQPENKVYLCLARGFLYMVVIIDWCLCRVLSWRISMKPTCFAAVMKARGLNIFRDGRYMSQKNSSLSLLSGIVLTILTISGLYPKVNSATNCKV